MSKNKKIATVLIILGMLASIPITIKVVQNSGEKSAKQEQTQKEETPEVSEDELPLEDGELPHNEKITAKSALTKIANGEELVLYIGRPNCPYCVEYKKVQDEALEGTDKKVFYVNTLEAREDEESFNSLLDLLEVETVPFVAHIKGDSLEQLVKTNDLESVKEFFDKNLK